MSSNIQHTPHWNDMKDAPLDGTEIYAACDEDWNCHLKWRDDCKGWQDTRTERFESPLAWMPVPVLE